MTKKIFLSIMTISGIVVLAAVLLVAALMHKSYSDKALAELSAEGDIIAAAVDLSGRQYLDRTDFGNIRVTWIDSGGMVVFDTEEDDGRASDPASSKEVSEAFESGQGSSSRDSDTLLPTALNYAKRITDGSVIRVSSVHDSLAARLTRLLSPILLILAGLALFSILAAVFTARRIVRPINDIDLDNPRSDKSYKELSPLLTKLRDQNGRAARQMEELRQSREQFSLITESMNEGLIIADSKTFILSGNSAAFRLLDTQRQEGRQSIFSLDRTEKFRRCIQDAMGGRRSECIISTKDGDRQVIASPTNTPDMLIGIVVFILDVTEKQQLETMRREFTSNVSHELKTPLTTIHGIADMLAGGIVKPEDVPAFGADIRSESDRLITLISDIVSLSKLDEDSLPRQDEEVDLYELAAEVIARLKPNADSREIVSSLTGEHVIFTGNRTVLDEIIYNLCDNAIKYNVDGGSYEVRVSHIPTKALITVSDTGTGIPAAHLSRIFERFYRVDKSRSRKIKGTGLGLSIVKHGVMYHNGEIRTESVPGKGTTFIVELPLV